MTTISQSDPTSEAVKKMVPPPQPGVSYVMCRCIVTELAPAKSGESAFVVQNPELVDCIITNVTVDITTAADAAKAALDIDVVSAPDSRGNGIIDGLSLAATGTFDRCAVAAGKAGGNPVSHPVSNPVRWDRRDGENDFITGTVMSANALNLAGLVVIEFIPLG